MRQWSGDAVGAEGLLRRALEILPEYAFHWRALALCLAIQDQFAEAEMIATEGCRRFPESVDLPPLLRAIRGEPPLPE